MIGFNIMEVLTELKQMPLEDLKKHKAEMCEYYRMVKSVLQYREIEE